MEHTFARFVYLDTNVLSEIAKRPETWQRLKDYLIGQDLTLAISAGQVAELSSANRLHERLVQVLTSVPSAIIKEWNVVLTEEVGSHPNNRSASLLLKPLNAMLLEEGGPAKLIRFLSSPELKRESDRQRATAAQMLPTYQALRSNFPPKSDGKYCPSDGKEYADCVTLQSLDANHRSFLEGFRNDVGKLRLEVFKSLRLQGLVVFYKYYLGGRLPKKLSDFGDQSHLYAIPYCVAAVVERDLANVLRQIKRHHSVLAETEIFDIDWLEQFS